MLSTPCLRKRVHYFTLKLSYNFSVYFFLIQFEANFSVLYLHFLSSHPPTHISNSHTTIAITHDKMFCNKRRCFEEAKCIKKNLNTVTKGSWNRKKTPRRNENYYFFGIVLQVFTNEKSKRNASQDGWYERHEKGDENKFSWTIVCALCFRRKFI